MPKKSTSQISAADRALAAVSYIWILWLISMVLGGHNEFVSRHAKQGLVLFIAEIVLMALSIIPLLGWLIGFLGFIAAVIAALTGLVRAWRGEDWEIPFIGQFSSRINI